MIDTLKVGIPLSEKQHSRIRAIAAKNDRWYWVMFNEIRGEMLFRRVSGLAGLDQNSYHRELRWDVSPSYEPNCLLTLEFSVPKYWYGHNIHLLYDFVTPLRHLRDLLNEQFGLKGKARLVDVMQWQVLRADPCYAWRLPSQDLAHQFLCSLKRLHYPRKQPIIYSTAIVFVGTTYSLKIYEKLPEFKTHDLKELRKGQASLEWINHLEAKAEGVLRLEATLRHKYLKRQGISTIADLSKSLVDFEIDYHEGILGTPEFAIFGVAIHNHLLQTFSYGIKEGKLLVEGQLEAEKLIDGKTYSAPSELVLNGQSIKQCGKSFTIKRRDNPTAILQYFLIKFVGENAGMQKVDEVRTKLLDTYKPVKAARLVSFWLYVQKFGSSEAKDAFGHNSYYVAKRDIKKAGVSLIEPPERVTAHERDALQRFRLEIPSEFSTNKFDDYRESDNVLNFVPKVSGNF